jgi:hypothetical protein
MAPRRTILVLGLALAACAPQNLARQVSRAAIDEGAEELTRDDTQQSLREASADPKLQAAAQDMTRQIAEGVLQAMESPRAREQMTAITRAVTQAAVQQMVAALGNQQTLASMQALTRGATDAALKQVAANLKTDLGPSMRALLEDEVALGIAGALRSDAMQPALGRAIETTAHHAMLGFNSGAGAAWNGNEGAMREARMLPGVASGWLIAAFALLGLTALIFVSGAVMLMARARRTHNEVARLESATLLLATAMRERQQTEQTDEILAVVQQALEGRAEKTGKHRILNAIRMRRTG